MNYAAQAVANGHIDTAVAFLGEVLSKDVGRPSVKDLRFLLHKAVLHRHEGLGMLVANALLDMKEEDVDYLPILLVILNKGCLDEGNPQALGLVKRCIPTINTQTNGDKARAYVLYRLIELADEPADKMQLINNLTVRPPAGRARRASPGAHAPPSPRSAPA